jgi:hypothetical protein
MLEMEVSQDDLWIGVRIVKVSKYLNLFRTEFQQTSRLPKVITPKSLIVWGHVNNRWKNKKLATNFLLRFFRDGAGFWVKSRGFSDCSNLISPEFEQSSWLQNCITPKPWILSRHANNRWKDQKVLYRSCICLQVRFPLEQSQICTYWLLLAVKSDSALVPKFSFWTFLGGSKDGHLSWYFNIMMGYLSCFH